jgi:hypothetical protein
MEPAGAYYLLVAITGYLVAGLVFGLVVGPRAARAIDPAAAAATRGFVVAIFPGLVLLWPVVLAVFARKARDVDAAIAIAPLRKIHGAAFAFLALSLPPAMVLAWRAAPKFDRESRDAPAVRAALEALERAAAESPR